MLLPPFALQEVPDEPTRTAEKRLQRRVRAYLGARVDLLGEQEQEDLHPLRHLPPEHLRQRQKRTAQQALQEVGAAQVSETEHHRTEVKGQRQDRAAERDGSHTPLDRRLECGN